MIENKLKTLFSPGIIGNVKIKNRIVRSATLDGRANNGYITEDQVNFYNTLANGGTGLIITGGTLVDKSGTMASMQANLYDDSYISGQKKLVKAVHEYPDVKIAVQLHHPGRQAVLPEYPPLAPSAVPNLLTKKTPRELKVEEIKTLINSFVEAGCRAYECEYDLIQIHAGHGYLVSNFLSPYMNRREDEFGGNTKKRVKILIDLRNQLKDRLGKQFPIIVKLQTKDGFQDGIDLEEAKNIAQILIKEDYAAIEPTGGSQESMIMEKFFFPSLPVKNPEDENYFLKEAITFKTIDNCCPIVLVGGIRNPVSAESILQEGIADFLSLSRPLIREPDLPNRWRNGDISPIQCISCNACLGTMGAGIHCVPKKKRERKLAREALKFKN